MKITWYECRHAKSGIARKIYVDWMAWAGPEDFAEFIGLYKTMENIDIEWDTYANPPTLIINEPDSKLLFYDIKCDLTYDSDLTIQNL